MITAKDLRQAASEAGIVFTGVVKTGTIRFHEDFRKACEKNACGKYATNWMGPPAIGPISELKKRVLLFNQGLVFQTVHPLTGSFNMKGMLAAAKEHQRVFRKFLDKIRDTFPKDPVLPLDAGCCGYCERCAYMDTEPCRHPDHAVSSVEAYGMDVSDLMKNAELRYYHGKGTVCFVGLILFDS
jgi:predicted metal-binding protein